MYLYDLFKIYSASYKLTQIKQTPCLKHKLGKYCRYLTLKISSK